MSQRALSGQSLSHVPPRRPCISPPRTRAASSVSARRVTRAAAGAGSAHGPGPLPRGPRSPPPPPPLAVECLPPPRGARSKAKAAPGRPRLERPGPAARQPLPQHSLSPSTGTRPLTILSAPAQAPALSAFSQTQQTRIKGLAQQRPALAGFGILLGILLAPGRPRPLPGRHKVPRAASAFRRVSFSASRQHAHARHA